VFAVFVVPWKRTVTEVPTPPVIWNWTVSPAFVTALPVAARVAPPAGATKLSQPVVEPAGTCGLPHGQLMMPPTRRRRRT
jgi:hypothetical protein